MVLSVPLPALPWSPGSQAGLLELLLEEWLLRPLQSLATVRPVAEFYRLKRKMVDSPFRRETLAVFNPQLLCFWGGFIQSPPLPDRPGASGGRPVRRHL